jgi:chloramphenicol-sensitive protein RarD
VVFLLFVLTMGRQWPGVLKALRNRKVLLILFATAVLNSLNWGAFIYSVISDQLLASSLGYFLNPLVSVVLGFVFLRERLSRIQQLAIAIAAIGVLTQIIGFGELPWIALTIAISFGLYGLMRKTVDAGPAVGLFIECLLIGPFALGWLIWLNVQGLGTFGQFGIGYDAFIALAGVLTGVPLVLFAAGARRIKLATIGLLQYIAPSAYLVMALTIWREPFETADFITFGCIWLALLLYTREIWRTRIV